MTTIPPEAIEAAARALCSLGADEHGFTYCETHGVEIHVAGIRTCHVGREEAEAALTAALPHIEAAIRGQVAQEIDDTQRDTAERSDAFVGGTNLYERGKAYGLSVAARIARGAAR